MSIPDTFRVEYSFAGSTRHQDANEEPRALSIFPTFTAPIVNRNGRVVAAINVSAQDQRMPPDQMRKRLLPRLLESAASINTLMRMQD